jgi:hypothetical protein
MGNTYTPSAHVSPVLINLWLTIVLLDDPATETLISVESNIAELNSSPARIRSCPLSTSSKLIDGCLGEYSALNGPETEKTKRRIKVNPTNPFFKIISEETKGDTICFRIFLYSLNSERLIILKVIKLRAIIMKEAVIDYILKKAPVA